MIKQVKLNRGPSILVNRDRGSFFLWKIISPLVMGVICKGEFNEGRSEIPVSLRRWNSV